MRRLKSDSMTVASILWPEVVGALSALIGSVGVVSALIYSARQTRSVGEQARLQRQEAEREGELQQAKLELKLMELTMAIDKLFLDRPFLRPYFYDDRPLGIWATKRRRVQVNATAEVIIDFIDAIAGLRRHGQLVDDNYENWKVFTQSFYAQSPAVRDLWGQWAEYFPAGTAELLEPSPQTRLHADPPLRVEPFQAALKRWVFALMAKTIRRSKTRVTDAGPPGDRQDRA